MRFTWLIPFTIYRQRTGLHVDITNYTGDGFDKPLSPKALPYYL